MASRKATNGRAKAEACKDCELFLPEGCSGMFLGERTGVTYKGRCTETSKNALSRIWRVEEEKPEPQLESSAAEQTAVVRDTGWGEGGLFIHGRHLPALAQRESEAGDAPMALSSLKLLLAFSHALLLQGKSVLKNEEHCLSHGSSTLAPLWSRLGFSFFFCLTNYFSTFKVWQRFQRLSVPSYRLWQLIVPSLCLVRTLHIT